MQVLVLKILGKAAYYPCVSWLEHGLGLDDELLRYRIMMSTYRLS